MFRRSVSQPPNNNVNAKRVKLSFIFSTYNILINSLYFKSDFKIDLSGGLRHLPSTCNE